MPGSGWAESPPVSRPRCETCWMEAAQVSLLRWLRRQLRQPIPIREHLEAAVENDDVAEARRLLAGFEFSDRSEEHTSELQSHVNLVCRLLLEKKKKTTNQHNN